MSPASGVVKMKPYCRGCGNPTPILHRCKKCGRRNWADLFGSLGSRH